jgi:NAD(P)-dependent dehydrogenase (short-subunit alcohol dehydrogenase family)
MHSFTKQWHSKPYPFISSKRRELSAKGKNIVITGGGSGIGKAVAVGFAEAGAHSISIIGRREDVLKAAEKEIGKLNSKVFSVAADLTNGDQTKAAFESISKKFGKIDVLVSNAGSYDAGYMANYDAQSLMRSLELNVITALHACQSFLRLAAPNAVLLNTTSDMACMPAKDGWLGSGSYSIAKSAGLKFIDYFAAENPQIRTINVQPGWIPTELAGHDERAPDSGRFSLLVPLQIVDWFQLSFLDNFMSGLQRQRPLSSTERLSGLIMMRRSFSRGKTKYRLRRNLRGR